MSIGKTMYFCVNYYEPHSLRERENSNLKTDNLCMYLIQFIDGVPKKICFD